VTTGDEDSSPHPFALSIYTVIAEAPNFKKDGSKQRKLDVTKTNFGCRSRGWKFSETVSVTADPVTVNLTTASSSTLISGDQVRELSINNRNFVQL